MPNAGLRCQLASRGAQTSSSWGPAAALSRQPQPTVVDVSFTPRQIETEWPRILPQGQMQAAEGIASDGIAVDCGRQPGGIKHWLKLTAGRRST
jgi:hypothetical protein